MAEQELGATGEFPDGKLGPEDEGELALEVSCGPGIVKLDFGKKVRWIALSPADAANLAMMIIAHAQRASAALEEKQKSIILSPDGAPSRE